MLMHGDGQSDAILVGQGTCEHFTFTRTTVNELLVNFAATIDSLALVETLFQKRVNCRRFMLS